MSKAMSSSVLIYFAQSHKVHKLLGCNVYVTRVFYSLRQHILDCMQHIINSVIIVFNFTSGIWSNVIRKQ